MTAALRVLLVDDEPPALRRLTEALSAMAEVELVGQCRDGLAAVQRLRASEVDLVLLDVQMPGCDGFEVIERVGPARMPAVVFVTAHDEYAVRAFDVHALDYLEKPWDDARLREAVGRARQQRDWQRARARREQLEALLESRTAAARARLIVRSGARVVFLELDEIVRVEAAANYLRVHTADAEYLARETLASLCERLPSDGFVRIHRSHLVRIGAIRALGPDEDGEPSVTLIDGTRLRVGPAHRDALRQLAEG